MRLSNTKRASEIIAICLDHKLSYGAKQDIIARRLHCIEQLALKAQLDQQIHKDLEVMRDD